jgi:hypothetical protein
LGLRKRSHHSKLLAVLDLPPVTSSVSANAIKLYARLLKVPSPAKTLNLRLLSRFFAEGTCPPSTLLYRVLSLVASPTQMLTAGSVSAEIIRVLESQQDAYPAEDGLIDSLKEFIFAENFVKPWCYKFVLTLNLLV